MKKIIIVSILSLLSFNSFSQSILVFDDKDIYQTMTEEMADPIYDYIMFNLHDYYRKHYKYPENIDTFVNYLYCASLHFLVRDEGLNVEDAKKELEQLKYERLSVKERWGLTQASMVFNYCYVHKNQTNFIYETDYIVLLCGADSVYFTYRKADACIDRYSDRLSDNRFVPIEGAKFYDKTGEFVSVDIEEIENLYQLIRNIIRDNYKEIWLEDKRPTITAILKYNKEDGLSSFCSDDNIDLEHDPFFIDVKNILNNFMMDYSSIHSIIMPLYCCESKTIN